MARQLTGKWTNGKAAIRWESQFLTQDVGAAAHRTSQPMARQLTGKWTNGKAANWWENQFLIQNVGGGGAQEQPTNGKAANG
jgi:hypothetical protein